MSIYFGVSTDICFVHSCNFGSSSAVWASCSFFSWWDLCPNCLPVVAMVLCIIKFLVIVGAAVAIPSLKDDTTCSGLESKSLGVLVS